MAQQQIVMRLVASVERARDEVNKFKEHVSHLLRTDSNVTEGMGRQLTDHAKSAELHVEKAEGTVKRIRQGGRVPPRPTASDPPSERAKRALAVLRAGLDGEEEPGPGPAKKPRVMESRCLSAAGKKMARPIPEDKLEAVLVQVQKSGVLTVGKIGKKGVGFECKNVFRALLWWKELVDDEEGGVSGKGLIVPEHIGCFGIDETNASRWGCSHHAVFQVMTERANAAIRYYMARERKGEDAILALASWLERHKTLFTAECENRRLAFDASRGMFLPPCIYPFEGNGKARFTRGSIPLRSHSSQNPVRMPSNTQASQGGKAQGGSYGSGVRGGGQTAGRGDGRSRAGGGTGRGR